MKAKELAEKLLKHPESEILINVYTGGATESLSVEEIEIFKTGELVNMDSGDFLEEDGTAKCDVIVITI